MYPTFSLRREHSEWTELNKERCKLLDKLGKLTKRSNCVIKMNLKYQIVCLK